MPNRFTDLFRQADEAFDGRYNKELNALTGLSRTEIDSVVPGNEDLRVYSVLIKVVEQASRENKTQAQLLSDIKELGDVAVKIAKKIPSLAGLF